MDFDKIGGGLIYVIIIAVLSLIKFLGKKKANASSTPNAPKTKDIFDTIFGDVFAPETSPSALEPVFKDEYTDKYRTDMPITETVIEKPKKEYTTFKRKETRGVEEFNSNESSNDDFNPSDLDLKKAIIYSEILNSKYC